MMPPKNTDSKARRRIDRRSFLNKGAKTLTVGLTVPVFSARRVRWHTRFSDAQTMNKKFVPEYRSLGRTGLELSTVGYGAMRTRDPAIIHRAIDLGVNYIDTAHSYMDGYNEVVVGKVLKTRRKETYVATKVHIGSADRMMASLEASLKSLNTDYVDIIQLHDLKRVSQLRDEDALGVLQKVKEEGKARFVGFTTHRNQIELLRAASEMDIYDMILVAYNFKSPDELGSVIHHTADAGIGIVAMKTQAGGYKSHQMGNVSPHQAALRWVLQNPGVTAAIPSMVTHAQLEEDIRAMGTRMGWMDRKTLHRYGRTIDALFCRMCDACRGGCPQDVDVFDVNRALMYADGYCDTKLAMATYRRISLSRKPDACLTCRRCLVRCRYGLNVHEKMKRAAAIFA